MSRLCPKPKDAPDTIRTRCPGCHEHHRDFIPCLKKVGYRDKGWINSRLARIIQTLKRRRRPDLLGKWKDSVVEGREWLRLTDLFRKGGERTSSVLHLVPTWSKEGKPRPGGLDQVESGS